MNQAIHSVDLLSWLMGPVVEIRAQTATLAHERIAVEDTAVATLRFASGALGVVEASTATFPGYLKRLEIHGDRIRASQGHSRQGMPVTLDALEASWEPHAGAGSLWHGTHVGAVEGIAREGILPVERSLRITTSVCGLTVAS